MLISLLLAVPASAALAPGVMPGLAPRITAAPLPRGDDGWAELTPAQYQPPQGFTNATDGELVKRQGRCPQLVCRTSSGERGTCVPYDGVCCDNGQSYCYAGNYCVSGGCCPRGRVCRGYGGTDTNTIYDTQTTTRTTTATGGGSGDTTAFTPYDTYTITTTLRDGSTATIQGAGHCLNDKPCVTGPFIGMNGQDVRTIDLKTEVDLDIVGTPEWHDVTCPSDASSALRLPYNAGGTHSFEFELDSGDDVTGFAVWVSGSPNVSITFGGLGIGSLDFGAEDTNDLYVGAEVGCDPTFKFKWDPTRKRTKRKYFYVAFGFRGSRDTQFTSADWFQIHKVVVYRNAADIDALGMGSGRTQPAVVDANSYGSGEMGGGWLPDKERLEAKSQAAEASSAMERSKSAAAATTTTPNLAASTTSGGLVGFTPPAITPMSRGTRVVVSLYGLVACLLATLL